jgi:hypothetical protein
VSEEFADAFAAGNFRDRGRNIELNIETTDISERITVMKDDSQSHAAGFEASVLVGHLLGVTQIAGTVLL